MGTNLPTNIDTTYADRSPGDAEHQAHHDAIHAYTNSHDTAVDPHGDRAYADATFALASHAHTGLTALGTNTKSSTAVPANFPPGASYVVVGATSGTWPGSGAGTLRTFNDSDSAFSHQMFVDSTSPPRVFFRRWIAASTTWSSWGEK